MKKEIKICIIATLLFICWLSVSIYGIITIIQQHKIIIDRETTIVNIQTALHEEEKITKYDFIDYDIAVYIEQLSIGLGIKPELAFSILMVENPEFDNDAINRNENGTIDFTLWQLNDRYFWTTFKDSYWNFEDVELDPMNWRHSTYIALHHIAYLQEKLKIEDDVIMAYNCGVGAVMNRNIPARTKVYLAKVKNNMKLLENIND